MTNTKTYQINFDYVGYITSERTGLNEWWSLRDAKSELNDMLKDRSDLIEKYPDGLWEIGYIRNGNEFVSVYKK